MRRIQKTFSLEPMTSRMPSVLPAYKDNTLYYFDDIHLKEREYKYPSNYGMIPLNIKLSNLVVIDDILYPISGWSDVTLAAEQCFCNESGCTRPCYAMIPRELLEDEDEAEFYNLNNNLCDFTMSFERLSKWYYFFKEYYHLLNDYGHCNRTYSSAEEYYYYESGERYADQMIYGTNEQTYKDLDAEFAAKGGIVDVDNIKISGATDIGFYKWICDNIVPTYYISKEYVEYWKRKKLYYPDVIKWIAWFDDRLWYETEANYTSAVTNSKNDIVEKEHWNCKESGITDCCDCEEYFNRGGMREYERMVEWYNGLQDNILLMNSAITENLDCFIPTMDDKIQLHNSLDDLGQYTIFSKEYERGIDYRTASYGDTENTHGGTVVEVSGNTMILRESDTGNTYSGFIFSPYYMEKQYDEESWDNYTNMYISGNPEEFIADGYNYYAFDENGKVYTGITSGDVIDNMIIERAKKIVPIDAILIDETVLPIQKSEYGIYDTANEYIGGKKFFVQREKDTSTPYTLINGKKVYAEWYQNPNPEFDNRPCYYFTFFKNENQKINGAVCDKTDNSFNITNYKPFGRTSGSSTSDTISYISYMGQIFQIEDGDEFVEIGETAYPRVIGYAYDDDNVIMYCVNISGTTIAVYDYELREVPNSEVVDDYIVISLEYEPQIYSARELSGQTVSKLTDLESTNVLIDDIGNKIDGKYMLKGAANERPYNHQPLEGAELDLLYEVGNTSNINRISGLTVDNLNDISGNTNYFIGNIITDMVFYYKDVSGNIVEDTVYEWSGSSLDTIHLSQSARTDIETSNANTVIFDGDDIYCDVTYYMGATLGRESGGTFFLAYDENNTGDTNYNYGVQYKETVKFVKENREYYLKKQIKKQIPTKVNSVSAHSVSYPIYVYKLKQDFKEIEGDVYNTYFQSPLAKFKTEINLINEDLTTNYSGYIDMPTYNNIHVSPTFKEEYMLGISSLENVNSDIYIERGINAAFEKHLKLGEITSMEALEQYGLTFFKIIDT